jgi:PiT family inorganic phosphate transporter
MSAPDILLLLVVLGFAWNIGAHYTGATMGMPYAAGSVALMPALVLIGLFAFIGAAFASGRVEETVGLHIISAASVTVVDAIVIVAAAGLLTLIYNYRKVPTSTIQILVFSVVGVGTAAAIPVAWDTIWHLALIWIFAPVVAYGLGFGLTRLLDLIIPSDIARTQVEAHVSQPMPQVAGNHRDSLARKWFPSLTRPVSNTVVMQTEQAHRVRSGAILAAVRAMPSLLLVVGIAASFVMGANDVSNASGALIMSHRYSLLTAGMIGGAAIAIGAITWGRRILQTVAFDVVNMDLSMATAAQGVQALVVLVAVSQGFFTSMNQALIASMAGTGLARGRQTVHRKEVAGILLGWLIGPISGFVLAFAGESVVRMAGLR